MMVIVNWGCSEPRDILLKIQMAGVTSVTGFRWTEKPPRPKLPFATAMKDGRPFTFAGLWGGWKEPESGEWFRHLYDYHRPSQ